MSRTWIVMEDYPDGGKWMHHFFSQEEAEKNMQIMQEAHPARTYSVTIINQ